MSDSTHEGTNEGALWGARFATGPSPELVVVFARSDSTNMWVNHTSNRPG